MSAKINTGLFSSIKTSKVSEEVYRQLVSLIGSGKLKPGDQLPPERSLASELGVSRQSVREAIYKAEVMGLLQVRQGEGSFVLSSVGELLKPPLAVLLEAESEAVFDFLAMRKLLEGWCAERAALAATDEDLAEIKDVLDRMERTELTDKDWEHLDVEFHLSVAAASHNVVAVHIMEALKHNFDVFFNFRQRIKEVPDSAELIWQHHYDVYRAIADRDPRLARQKLEDHLNYIEDGIRTNLDRI
ncbi:MAG: FadR/GntR family transcriptional regulator [Thermodesulfobacteriota bacterium]